MEQLPRHSSGSAEAADLKGVVSARALAAPRAAPPAAAEKSPSWLPRARICPPVYYALTNYSGKQPAPSSQSLSYFRQQLVKAIIVVASSSVKMSKSPHAQVFVYNGWLPTRWLYSGTRVLRASRNASVNEVKNSVSMWLVMTSVINVFYSITLMSLLYTKLKRSCSRHLYLSLI